MYSKTLREGFLVLRKISVLAVLCMFVFGLNVPAADAWVDYKSNSYSYEFQVYNCGYDYLSGYSPWYNYTSSPLGFSADYGNGISYISVSAYGKSYYYTSQYNGGAQYYAAHYSGYTPAGGFDMWGGFRLIVYYQDGTSNTFTRSFTNSGSISISGYNAAGSIANRFYIYLDSAACGAQYQTACTEALYINYTQAGQFADQAGVDAAKMAAQQAKASADQSLTQATSAVNILNGTSNGGKSLAATYDLITNLDTSLSNYQNTVANYVYSDTSPPVVKMRTASGAAATSGSTIRAVLDVSDNRSSTFTYSLDSINYQSLPADKIIALSVNSPGINVIPVWVKDEAGNLGSASITIRKI